MAFSIRTPSLKVIGRKLKMKSKFLVSSVKLSAAMALLLMSGCAEYHKRVLDCTEPKGNEFCDTLAKEYKILGDTEQSIMYDEISADYYYRKALKASKECDSVLPACLEDWDIPEDKLAELQTARARLVRALANGARRDAPKMTAYAQAHFDCWVEQQAEGWQKLDIAHCRSEFYASMAEVEVMLMGGFTNVSPSNMVFFDLTFSPNIFFISLSLPSVHFEFAGVMTYCIHICSSGPIALMASISEAMGSLNSCES